MSAHQSFDYARITKLGFIASIALVVVGGGSELLAATLHWPLPALADTLLFDMEVLGILGMVFFPFVTGIFLPLVD